MIQQAPSSLVTVVSRELVGERVLWASTPERWGYARKNWKKMLLGIPFLGFSLFWESMAVQVPAKKAGTAAAAFFPLWGLIFVGAGVAMLLSPIYAAWLSGSIYYVVTARRAIIFEKSFRLRIHSFDASSFSGFERISSGGAAGSIIFQRNIERRDRGASISEVGFIGLRSYAEAEQALRRMMDLRVRS